MAQSKGAAQPIILENRGRFKYALPYRAPEGSHPDAGVPKLVIGDSRDSDRILESRGIERDPAVTPNPVVELTLEQWGQLTAKSQAIIRQLVHTREITAINLPAPVGA